MSYQTTALFGDGLRCATGQVMRFTPPQNSGAAGSIQFGPGFVSFSCGGGGYCITPASTWNFQAWFRDPGGPCGSGFNTSNAVGVLFLP